MNKVRRANKASAAQLGRSIVTMHLLGDTPLQFSVKTPPDLLDDERDHIWRIFEDNMFQFYTDSSFGWDPPRKREELYHPSSRFILVQSRSHETGEESVPVVAFAMFRFEREDAENVVYCYEIQVSHDFRGKGLGKILMHQLNNVGLAWGMRKIMLTALKANFHALRFYEALGFTMDVTSPDYVNDDDDEWVDEDTIDTDYRIMSKAIIN